MIFTAPFLLLLAVPAAIFFILTRPAARVLAVLRCSVLVLLVLAVSGLALKLKSRDGVLVVVADRSKSMPGDAEARQKEMIQLIQKDSGRNNRLAVVSFGAQAAVEHAAQHSAFGGFLASVNSDASNMSEAIDLALSCIPQNTPGRILLISDGKFTGSDPILAGSRSAIRSIPIDYRLTQRSETQDTAIYSIDAPSHVGINEAFVINAWIQSPVGQEIKYELRRGSQVIVAGSRAVSSGMTRLSFRDEAKAAGNLQYHLKITPSGPDSLPENNIAKLLVGTEDKKPILCVSKDSSSQLAAMLNAGNVNTTAATSKSVFWTIEELSSYCAVILENVPASDIGNNGMETLAQLVTENGMGLMITGGKQSYGPGGYFKSPLEPLMPVSMELRQEHRKFSTAIVIAMDRSGSMAVPIAGGKTKMDLANVAAVEVLDLLSDLDEIGIIAVDSSPHVIVPMHSVADVRERKSDILSIQSMGGGIFVYEALSKAAQMVANSTSNNRHIILFADAADSEEPGEYKELLAKCVEAGITVSVIGLGGPSDVDARFLEEIAFLGKGQIYFTQDAMELPRLFAQDTFMIARNSFIEQVTPLEALPGMITVSGQNEYNNWKDNPSPAAGYNLCYLRPSANLAVETTDENKAPVVAAWQSGAGRVLCLTVPAADEFTGQLAKWEHYSEFMSSLARWSAGQDSEQGDYIITQAIDNGVFKIRMLLDPDREREISAMPQVSVVHGYAGQKPEVKKGTMKFKDADTLEFEMPVVGSQTLLGMVSHDNKPETLAPICLPYSPEFSPAAMVSGEHTLKKLSRITQGKERISLDHIWADMPKKPRFYQLAPWLIIGAMCILLVEVFERRTGILASASFKLPRFETEKPVKRADIKPVQINLKTQQTTKPEENTPVIKTPQKLGRSLSDARKKADQFLKK